MWIINQFSIMLISLKTCVLFVGSWLVNLLRNMLRIFQDIPAELLRKSWKYFSGNSQEWVLKNFSLKIPKKIPQKLSTFSAVLVTRNSLELVTRNFLDSHENFLGMSCKKFLRPGSSEWVTRNPLEYLSTFSPDFPVKDSWEFLQIFCKIITWGPSLTIYYLYINHVVLSIITLSNY